VSARSLDFSAEFNYLNLGTQNRNGGDVMGLEIECPICDADIPLESDDKSGDVIQCSYCKEIFKLLKTKDKMILVEGTDE
jgi:hypothetical protein